MGLMGFLEATFVRSELTCLRFSETSGMWAAMTSFEDINRRRFPYILLVNDTTDR